MTKTSAAWSMEREVEYHALMQYLGASRHAPASAEMFDLHKLVVRILDGEEPDPRQVVPRILGERIDLTLDETDREPPLKVEPPPSTDEVIRRLRDVGAFVAEADADPPTRLRHCYTIDQAIAKLRERL